MTKRAKRKNTRHKKFPVLFITIALFVVGVGITVAANGFASIGYQASKAQKTINSLKEENKNLELQAANLQSIQKLSEDVSNQASLVPVSKLQHIEQTGVAGSKNVGQR